MVRRIFGFPSHHLLWLFLVGLATVRLSYAAAVTGHGSPTVASPTTGNAVPVANTGRGTPNAPLPSFVNTVAAPTDGRGNPSGLSPTPSAGNTSPLGPPNTMSASTSNFRALRTPDYCNLMPYTGICRAYLPSWFYNITTGICELFVYGGCGGNRNRFDTWPTCMAACANPGSVPMPRPLTEEDFPPSSIQDVRNTSSGIMTLGNGSNELPTLRAATTSWNQLLANLYNTNASGTDHVHDIPDNNNGHVGDNHVMSFAPRKLLHT